MGSKPSWETEELKPAWRGVTSHCPGWVWRAPTTADPHPQIPGLRAIPGAADLLGRGICAAIKSKALALAGLLDSTSEEAHWSRTSQRSQAVQGWFGHTWHQALALCHTVPFAKQHCCCGKQLPISTAVVPAGWNCSAHCPRQLLVTLPLSRERDKLGQSG